MLGARSVRAINCVPTARVADVPVAFRGGRFELTVATTDEHHAAAIHLASVADALVSKGTWIIGGDGWAYDIGFGALDHVLSSGRDVNILGANDTQTTKALLEAAAWPGPGLVIAYSTCIAHGIDMSQSMTHQKDAVRSGYWPLYRFSPPTPCTGPRSTSTPRSGDPRR